MSRLGFTLKHTREPFLYPPKVEVAHERPSNFGGEDLPTNWRYRAQSMVKTSAAYADEFDDVTTYRLNGPKVTIHIRSFRVTKRTPRGAWITVDGERRFVLDGAGKRFAHETPELALESLWKRSSRRMLFLQRDLEDIELTLYALEELKKKEAG